MKKMIAMLLAVLEPCALAPPRWPRVFPEADAAAEQAALADLTAEGQLIEGESFQFYIPADWESIELGDEEIAEGYVFCRRFRGRCEQPGHHLRRDGCGDDRRRGRSRVWPRSHPTATVQDLNGTSVVAFHDAEEDVLGVVVMDTVDAGYYIFMFTPASDEGVPAGG